MGVFCPLCGSILPLPNERSSKLTCYTCNTEYTTEVYGSMKTKFTIVYNSMEGQQSSNVSSKTQSDGPIVKRKCPMCENNKMSYATLQLRSADEGQTVFYTCTKCKYKEAENS